MRCKLCLQSKNIAFRLASDKAIQQCAADILRKYFAFCFQDRLSNDPALDDSICHSCWPKVKDFHDFYIFIENVYKIQSESIHLLPRAKIKEEKVIDDGSGIQSNLADLKSLANRPLEAHPTRQTINQDNKCSDDKKISRLPRKKCENRRIESIKTLDGEDPKRCDICEIWLSNAKKMYAHNKSTHQVFKFKCNVNYCVESYHTDEELQEHIRDRHAKKKCPHCLREVVQLKEHIGIVHDGCRLRYQKYICEICGRGIRSKSEYEAHFESAHLNMTYECDICGDRFKSKFLLKRHMNRRHVRNRLYECNFCHREFVSNNALYKHRKTHSDETKYRYKCFSCGKGYAEKSKLKEHESVHTGNFNLQCSLCDKMFRFSSSLALHRKKVHRN